MTIRVDEEINGEYHWYVISDDPRIPAFKKIGSSYFYLNDTYEMKFCMKHCLAVTDIKDNRLQTTFEFDDGRSAVNDFTFSQEGIINKRYVGYLKDAKKENICIQEFKRIG